MYPQSIFTTKNKKKYLPDTPPTGPMLICILKWKKFKGKSFVLILSRLYHFGVNVCTIGLFVKHLREIGCVAY